MVGFVCNDQWNGSRECDQERFLWSTDSFKFSHDHFGHLDNNMVEDWNTKKNIKSLDFLKNFKVNTVRTRQMELQVGSDTVVVHHPNFCTKKNRFYSIDLRGNCAKATNIQNMTEYNIMLVLKIKYK